MEISLTSLSKNWQEFRKMDRGQIGDKVVTIIQSNMPELKKTGAVVFIVASLALIIFAGFKLYEYLYPKPPKQDPDNQNPPELPLLNQPKTSQDEIDRFDQFFSLVEGDDEPSNDSWLSKSTLDVCNLTVSYVTPGTDWLTQSQMARQEQITVEELCKSTLNINAQEDTIFVFEEPTTTIANALTAQLGGKLHAVYQASQKLQEALTFAKNNAPRIGNTAFTIMFGLGKIFDGNFGLGAVALTSAAKELYDMKSTNGVELDKIFNNMKGNFQVINKLGEQEGAMLEKISTHIMIAKEEIGKIALVFNELQELSDCGNEELKHLHNKTTILQTAANTKMQKGLAALASSSEKTGFAKDLFELCWKNIKEMNELVTQESPEEDVIKKFVELTSGLEGNFKKAMNFFNESHLEFQNGWTLVMEGQKLHCEAKCGVELIKAATVDILEKIKAVAKQEENLKSQKEQLDQIDCLVEQIKSIEDKKKIEIEELDGNVKKAKNEINADRQKQLIAAGFLACFGAMAGGPVTAGFAATFGPQLLSEAQKFFTPITDLVTDFALPQNPGEVKSGFYTQTTGYCPSIRGRSKTGGVISIHLGDVITHYRFNLNEPNKGINLANLFNDLMNALKKNVLSKDQITGIFKELERMKFIVSMEHMMSIEETSLDKEMI